MTDITLLRYNNRNINYQNLASDLAAIEPPLWMALRATEFSCKYEVPVIIDLEVNDININKSCSRIEIFPSGNHPSAYIQQRQGIEELTKKLQKQGKTVKIWWELPRFQRNCRPMWGLFDLNKYRAHNWHCWGGYPRTPYGIVYSSFSCPYQCKFCAIHDFYGKYEEIPLGLVWDNILWLVKKGVKNLKFIDELFFYNPKRVEYICDKIIAEGFNDLNIWAYARIDLINKKLLIKLKRAGFRWLGIGIESGNEEIRKKNLKGCINNRKIKETVYSIQDSGIAIGANYIFGFPEDNLNTIYETFNFAEELNCEYSNFYTMMAYPGSQLYKTAKKNKWELPKNWSGYSQYSYDCLPVRTKYLRSEVVLGFRDNAFTAYYTNPFYLKSIKEKFGDSAVEDIKKMVSIKLKRKILE